MRRPSFRLAAVLTAIVAAGVLSGCGSVHNGAHATAPVSASSKVTTGAGGTNGTRTAPQNTTGTTTPQSALPGYQRPPVLLGDMNTPEQFILGQLYAWALRAQGYQVAVSRNIGAPAVAQEAMRQGSLDVYPDYLNDFNAQVAKNPESFSNLRTALAAARGYADAHGLVLLDPTPFSNTTGLAVTSWFARENNIWSLPQLARGPGVIVGAPPPYEQAPNGLPAIEHTYGVNPAVVKPVAIGQQYDALSNNVVQAAYIQTTDPELYGFSYKALSDPRHVAGIGNVVPVTTPKVIAQEGPVFVETLNRVDALLTLRAIRGLNAEVEFNNADPGTVAEEFLQANGIIPPPSSSGGS